MSQMLFSELFGGYLTDQALLQDYGQLRVSGCHIVREHRQMQLEVFSDAYISYAEQQKLEQALQQALSLSMARISVIYEHLPFEG